MINQLPSFQQALQALRVRKKQPAPMRVLAAACRFLGRLLFSFGLVTTRETACKQDIHRARWSNPRSPKQWCKDEPNRAQPKQGCLSLHPGVQLHLQVVDAHLQRSNPFSWLELSPKSVSVSLPLSRYPAR